MQTRAAPADRRARRRARAVVQGLDGFGPEVAPGCRSVRRRPLGPSSDVRPAAAWASAPRRPAADALRLVASGFALAHPYRDLGPAYFDERAAARTERSYVRRLEQLGDSVALSPAAA
jgi:hypothetical protein